MEVKEVAMHEPRANKIYLQLMQLIQIDGDYCSICGAEFADSDLTYGGVTKSGSVAYVSQCCVRELKEIYCGGIVVW
jgi:hypothetical protein